MSTSQNVARGVLLSWGLLVALAGDWAELMFWILVEGWDIASHSKNYKHNRLSFKLASQEGSWSPNMSR